MKRKFLAGTRMQYLVRAHERETDPGAKMRLLAAIHHKEGRSIREIAGMLKVPRTTVNRWLDRMDRTGLRGRYRTRHRGAECKLGPDQRRQLVLDLRAGPQASGWGTGVWTLELVKKHVKKRFGVDYDPSSVWHLLRRLKFSYITPRPRNRRGPTPAEREAFKKKAHRIVVWYVARGYVVLCLDEAHLVLMERTGRGWFQRGGRAGPKAVVPTSGRPRGRTSMFGVIGDGAHMFRFYDKADAGNLRDFLLRVHASMGRILVFMDNASYHRKGMLDDLARETDRGIVCRFFPAYAPELVPIEPQWREIKRHLANTVCFDIRDAKRTVMKGLRQGVIKTVRMQDCLTARPSA